MDDSLKKLEAQLETLSPRGLSNDAETRCHDLLDELASGKVSQSPIGWSWRVTSIAASIVLLIGMSSGWWLGQSRGAVPVSQIEAAPDYLASAFDLVDERSWMQVDGAPQLYLSANGEITELRTELDISEETVVHRDSGRLVTVRVTTRLPVEEATNQF
ncbi:hypothetical protein N9133_02115 [Akkermansiaceae bacterium]|nr:hypothetical protein [Akkermansiaceae bacterium]MDB4508547.1 hypothetical protein [Akkermansiaceae bacterium]MDB4545804.1 hypothetical protein [Akkermansiaceae bacterium]